MELAQVFEAELMANDISLCRGCDHRSSHKRGFVLNGSRTVHLDRSIATRSTLHRALHEVGHVVNAAAQSKMKRWQQEEDANRYAAETMRVLGISIPRKVAASGAQYVARKKRHGSRISRSLRGL